MSRRLPLLLLAVPAVLGAQQFPASAPARAPLVATGVPLAQEVLLPNGLRLVVQPSAPGPV